MSEQIRRILVWSGWLRLSHLLVGLSTLVLLVSGWLIEAAPSLEADAVDLHYLAAGFLVFGLALRLVLMFTGSPVERLTTRFSVSVSRMRLETFTAVSRSASGMMRANSSPP